VNNKKEGKKNVKTTGTAPVENVDLEGSGQFFLPIKS